MIGILGGMSRYAGVLRTCPFILLLDGVYLEATATLPPTNLFQMAGELEQVERVEDLSSLRFSRRSRDVRHRPSLLVKARKVAQGAAPMARGSVQPGEEVRSPYQPGRS